MKYIYLGKIVNTHGLKGELRILSDFKYKDRVIVPDNYLYLGKEKIKEKIVTSRKHKNFDMVTFFGYDSIDSVLKYKGIQVFISSDDLHLKSNEYLDNDLIGLNVIYNNSIVGVVTGIEKFPSSDIIVIKNEKKEYLIPYVFDIIDSINIEKGEIIVKNIKGLIE